MKSAIEVFGVRKSAFKAYTNQNVTSEEEFEEDYQKIFLAKKLAARINSEKTDSIRLLCNHIICITNVFDVSFVKEVFLHISDDEIQTIKTVLTYLNFLDRNEWPQTTHCLYAAKLLKEMDR